MANWTYLSLDQGSDFSASQALRDNTGAPLNLTGDSVRGRMRRSYYSAQAVNLTVTIPTPTNGVVNFSLTAAQTAALKSGRWVFDIELTASGTITRILEGIIEVMPGVTTPPSSGVPVPPNAMTGSGSPEGVVTADIGSYYVDLTNNGLWFKMTAPTPNTGWQQFIAL